MPKNTKNNYHLLLQLYIVLYIYVSFGIPKHNVLLTIDDFNAHISESNFNRYTYHSTTNTNGKLGIGHAEEAHLKVTNTNFRKRFGKLCTYMSDTNYIKTQVDFILIRNKWKNSVKNCEAYSNFSSIGLDHRIITSIISLA